MTAPSPEPELPSRPAVRRRLLAWFDRVRRDLPWRRDRDPYRIWVSEVMLQQTQVATVVPYFERFLQAFPTLADLAAADEQEVLRRWEGLGYYRRARDLHRAARALVRDHGGTIPDDPESVGKLPGVGRYILGAVLSQAFDRRLPIVEANSRRVLCRLFGREGDARSREADKWLWETAEALLPKKRAGDFNQALMELGALVCTPTAPKCEECPLARSCVAKRLGRQEEIPAKSPAPEIVSVSEVALVVRDAGRVLLAQRPPHAGRWAGMWEFPHLPLAEGEDHPTAARRVLAELVGLEAEVGGELLTLAHAVTRFRITMLCLEAHFRGGEFRSDFYAQARWLEPGELGNFPVSAPQRRLAKALTRPANQRSLF